MHPASSDPAPCAWLLSDGAASELRLWGVGMEERLRRSLAAAGVTQVRRWTGDPAAPLPESARQLVLRADLACDARLIRALLAAGDTLLLASATTDAGKERPAAACVGARHLPAAARALSNEAPSAEGLADPTLRVTRAVDLAPSHDALLRRADPPYALLVTPGNAALVERRIFDASYKGVTDLVTRWAWPAPARIATRWLAERSVHPNAVTALSWLLVAAATLLFAAGFAGSGLAVAWLMTFLDTVDGKLARVTLTSSRIGHVLDHGLDLLHPPIWYLAFAAGLPEGAYALELAVGVSVGGYVAGRILEGVFMLSFGFETHSWRPVDSWFRSVTARRNPNLLLLTGGALAGRPDLGLCAVAVWTALSLAFHGVRLTQALADRARGRPVRVWYAEARGGRAG